MQCRLKKTAIVSLLLLVPIKTLASNECALDYSIMYLIAMNEKHPNREVGYPYLISFNEKGDVVTAKKNRIVGFIDNRSIDCESKEKCADIVEQLTKLKIENVDLGAFQINRYWHKIPLKDYFDLKKSYQKGCSIASKFIDSENITFKDIAKYHSLTKKYNNLYANNLKKNYTRVIKAIAQ